MSEPVPAAVEGYLAAVDRDAVPLVRALDDAIRRAHAGFDVAVKYNLLMYAIGKDWRHWVVAVDAHPRASVGLRFLFGVLLDDPLHVLRAGSSVLMTWDIPRGSAVDEAAVVAYVAEAVAKYPRFRADEKAVLEAARAAAKH